jgi:D-alanyl-D-alanine carboxypeptidase
MRNVPRLPVRVGSGGARRDVRVGVLGSRLFAVAAALALLAVVAWPLGAGPVAASDAPLPECLGVYRDDLTAYRDYEDWGLTLLDTILRVHTTYAPPDLAGTGVAGGGQVRRFVRADLRAMAAAAADAGAPIQVVSAYRSYATQVWTYAYWVGIAGLPWASLASARPGHSEHQLGLAVDVTSLGGMDPWLYGDWAGSRAGAWMRAHAWEYGFVMSYPRGHSPTTTCYQYEPWHFRYVGVDTAGAIHAADSTLREYLWDLQP